jgi:hypothetical protein
MKSLSSVHVVALCVGTGYIATAPLDPSRPIYITPGLFGDSDNQDGGP